MMDRSTAQTATEGGTRERLLDAAGEIFAQKGFRKATVREIVRQAGANLNAVNYHFGDKEGLYRAVFEHAHHISGHPDPDAIQKLADLDPEDRLRTHITWHLRGMLSEQRPPWLARLRVREMTEPTGVLELLVEQYIRPHFLMLVAMIRELVGDGVSEDRVRLCATSVAAQCLHYHHARPVVSRLHPNLTFDEAGIGILADHITQFSLAALRNLPRDQEGSA